MFAADGRPLVTSSVAPVPQSINNTDRDHNYFLQMYLGDYRAIDYLATRPEWDGRTLVDPSNIDIADALGARTRPGSGIYDLIEETNPSDHILVAGPQQTCALTQLELTAAGVTQRGTVASVPCPGK